MNHSISNIRIARELVTRLESVFGVRPQLLRFTSEGWQTDANPNAANDCKHANEQALSIEPRTLSAILQMDLESKLSHVSNCDGRMQFLVHLTSDTKNRILLYFNLQGHNELMVRSLIASNIELLWHREDAINSKKQIESFIDQVTQDFEELTWLRNANEYLDLCNAKHSIESMASHCLPDLADVIRAQSILFVPAEFDTTPPFKMSDPSKIVMTGVTDAELSTCLQLLNDSLASLSCGPCILNTTSNQQYLPGYIGIKNSVLIPVAKGSKTYGWLLTINKISHQVDRINSEGPFTKHATASFGTFEASLLVAAGNIMSAQARNLEFLESQELLLTGVVRTIINAIDAKDPYTCGHSDRVASYAKRIAVRLGLSEDECEQVYMAGVLHDVGKIGVPDSILGKPGKLTDEEYAIVKKHPEIGHAILKHLQQLDYVLPGVLHHHEAVNGSGYPLGLIGEAIPLHGRILAVADAYDAMTSNRPYRNGMPSEKAEAILKSEAGKTWDSGIVATFLECIANDEFQSQTASGSAGPGSIPMFDEPNISSNSNLMWRIANSINNMVAG